MFSTLEWFPIYRKENISDPAIYGELDILHENPYLDERFFCKSAGHYILIIPV